MSLKELFSWDVLRLIVLLGTATMFEGYDRFIVALALPYIGRDLGAGPDALGYTGALIRGGGLLSLPLGLLADRYGRRTLLLVTVIAYTVATAATGLSRGIVDFALYQCAANVFLLTELSLAQVVMAEELPVRARAHGQAALGICASLGAGAASLLFPLMQRTVLRWRAMYFAGLAPLALVALLRRSLPETRRWLAARERGTTRAGQLRRALQPPWRARLLALLGIAMSVTAATATAFYFASYHATENHGWHPGRVTVMMVVSGLLGLSGWLGFGALAERWGRRAVGAIAFVGASGSIAAFYTTTQLMAAFPLVVASEAGCVLAINTLGTELFPTGVRSTAKVLITIATIVGGTAGTALTGALAERFGGIASVVPVLSLGPLAALPLLFVLPETRARELEEG